MVFIELTFLLRERDNNQQTNELYAIVGGDKSYQKKRAGQRGQKSRSGEKVEIKYEYVNTYMQL